MPKTVARQAASGVHRESETKVDKKLRRKEGKAKASSKASDSKANQTDRQLVIKGRYAAHAQVVLRTKYSVQRIQLHQDTTGP